jgi:hypothetical protein
MKKNEERYSIITIKHTKLSNRMRGKKNRRKKSFNPLDPIDFLFLSPKKPTQNRARLKRFSLLRNAF